MELLARCVAFNDSKPVVRKDDWLLGYPRGDWCRNSLFKRRWRNKDSGLVPEICGDEMAERLCASLDNNRLDFFGEQVPRDRFEEHILVDFDEKNIFTLFVF